MNARLKENKTIEVPQLIVSEINSYSIIFEVDYEGLQTYLNFELQCKEKRSSTPFETKDISENLIFYIGNLKQMSEYFFRIRGKINGREVSSWSKEILVRTIKTHPFSQLLNNPLFL